MNIYNAIMKAADSIESQPELYNFMECGVHTCDTPHCMIGWIGVHLGMKGKRVFRDVMPVLGLDQLGNIGEALGHIAGKHGDYVQDPKAAARLLRDFAQRFKPEITSIPDSVRAIFSGLKAAPDSLADMAGAPSVGRQRR